MGNKEIENLLEDNYKKLCEKSEELKEAISQKVDYEKNFVSAKEEVEQLNSLLEKMNEFWKEEKKKFFLDNLLNFIHINFLGREYKEKLKDEIFMTYLYTPNVDLRKEKYSNVGKKLSEVNDNMKKLFSDKYLTYDDLSGEVEGTKARLLFEAMLETGKILSGIENIPEKAVV